MIIEAIILGIIIGFIRKGKLSRLEYAKLNLSPLIFISIIAYIAIIVMNLGSLNPNSNIYSIFLVATYALIIIVIVFNLDKKYMFIPLVGIMLNFICLCVNSFKFPVKSEAIASIYGAETLKYLTAGKIKFFTVADTARLKMLGKIFYLGDYYFYNVLMSIGDIIICVGLVLIIQALMTDKYLKTKDTITISKSLYKKNKK